MGAPGVRGWYRFIVTWESSFGGEPKRSLTSQTPRGSAVLQRQYFEASVFPACRWRVQPAVSAQERFGVLAGRVARFGEHSGWMQYVPLSPGRSCEGACTEAAAGRRDGTIKLRRDGVEDERSKRHFDSG